MSFHIILAFSLHLLWRIVVFMNTLFSYVYLVKFRVLAQLGLLLSWLNLALRRLKLGPNLLWAQIFKSSLDLLATVQHDFKIGPWIKFVRAHYLNASSHSLSTKESNEITPNKERNSCKNKMKSLQTKKEIAARKTTELSRGKKDKEFKDKVH